MTWLTVTSILLAALSSICDGRNRRTINPIELRATKGQFFTYTLHSGNFFTRTVDVKWTASLRGRPALPLWLHLMPSRHKPLGYLYGTPITPLNHLTIHVIARSLDNYENVEQFITIFLTDNERYRNVTQQVAEIRIKNCEPEELIIDRNGIIDRLQTSLKESFRGRGLNPYIHEILPASNAPIVSTNYGPQRQAGCIVRVGTQSRFHVNILNLMRGLHKNPQYCNRNPLVPLDKYFAPIFIVDWCNFYVRNVTEVTIHDEDDWMERRPFVIVRHEAHTIQSIPHNGHDPQSIPTEKTPVIHTRHYFWESFLMFPMLGVCCILLLILLSLIFFGRREGQHWRDYKTPKQQLEEYASVRDSQRHLREMSIQRQMLLMASDAAQSRGPTGINSFLQPKFGAQSALASNDYQPEQSSQSSRSPLLKGVSLEKLASDAHTVVPLGKQTVAEAAKACGSSLHLYRNPFENATSDENDDQSIDEENDNKN